LNSCRNCIVAPHTCQGLLTLEDELKCYIIIMRMMFVM
jgi:hypothetical protein